MTQPFRLGVQFAQLGQAVVQAGLYQAGVEQDHDRAARLGLGDRLCGSFPGRSRISVPLMPFGAEPEKLGPLLVAALL